MRNIDLPVDRRLPTDMLPASDSILAMVLSANVAENMTVPTGARFVRLCTTVAAYLRYIESAESADLVTNGAFAADTGWTKGTGWSIAAGVAASDGSQTGQSLLQQAGGAVPGKAYSVTFTVTAFSAGNVRPKIGGTAGTNRASAATFTETIVAGADGVLALDADADFIGSVDNFIVAPIALVPTTEQAVAAELIPAGIEVVRYIESVSKLSLVSAGAPIVTASFYG